MRARERQAKARREESTATRVTAGMFLTEGVAVMGGKLTHFWGGSTFGGCVPGLAGPDGAGPSIGVFAMRGADCWGGVGKVRARSEPRPPRFLVCGWGSAEQGINGGRRRAGWIFAAQMSSAGASSPFPRAALLGRPLDCPSRRFPRDSILRILRKVLL